MPQRKVEVGRRSTDPGDRLLRHAVDDADRSVDHAHGPRRVDVGAARRRWAPPRGSPPGADGRRAGPGCAAPSPRTPRPPRRPPARRQAGDARRRARPSAAGQRPAARRRGGPWSRGTADVARTGRPGDPARPRSSTTGGRAAARPGWTRSCRRTRHTSRAAAARGHDAGRGPAASRARAQCAAHRCTRPRWSTRSVTVQPGQAGTGACGSAARTVADHGGGRCPQGCHEAVVVHGGDPRARTGRGSASTRHGAQAVPAPRHTIGA